MVPICEAHAGHELPFSQRGFFTAKGNHSSGSRNPFTLIPVETGIQFYCHSDRVHTTYIRDDEESEIEGELNDISQTSF